LTEKPRFDDKSGTLTFSPEAVRVLNVGTTEDSIVVFTRPVESWADILGDGDALFRRRLTPELRELGLELLQGVRKRFPSNVLQFHPRSKKFVDRPINFWTVRIQPRDRSLRLTVRGTLDEFPETERIKLVPDMTSYSCFKLTTPGQLTEALLIIGMAFQIATR